MGKNDKQRLVRVAAGFGTGGGVRFRIQGRRGMGAFAHDVGHPLKIYKRTVGCNALLVLV